MSQEIEYQNSPSTQPPHHRFSRTWTLSLFGTAVGAGVLFLPINAGMGGFWPLVVIALLVGPMTWLAHRGLARFVLSSDTKGSDITQVVEAHFGQRAGILITLLYFFAIYPILLIYGVGITNTVDSLIVNQLGMASLPRALLSFVLVGLLMSVMLLDEQRMLRITTWLVYPLVAILIFLSLYLIPHWNLAAIKEVPALQDFSVTLWLTIPVLVFAFNHSPAISSFSLAVGKAYPDTAAEQASRILRNTSGILLLFVMLFVFSCVLSVTPDDLVAAKAQNISMLSYLANKFDNPLISFFGPLVAILAISSSFFGHYLGAREGLHGVIAKLAQLRGVSINETMTRRAIVLFFFGSVWLVATLNPGILNIIESLGGPVIAAILFIMPVYALYTVPAMARWREGKSHLFVLLMGSIAISALVAGFI